MPNLNSLNYYSIDEYSQAFTTGPVYLKFSISSDTIIGTAFTPWNEVVDNFTLKLQGSNAVLL